MWKCGLGAAVQIIAINKAFIKGISKLLLSTYMPINQMFASTDVICVISEWKFSSV